MVSGKQGIQSRFGPSNRILELAQHKTSKTIWATTPCEKLRWGNSGADMARLLFGARSRSKCENPTPRQAQKRLLSKGGPPEERGGGEGGSFSRKSCCPSSRTSQYEHIVRLSTPKTNRRRSQEAGPPHTPQCENNCPIWHVDPKVKMAAITLRLLQLSNPKLTHPDFQSNRQSAASVVSFPSKTAQISQRLVQLSLPRLKESNVCCEVGRPEEPIWTVSRAARRATASARVEMLATPKKLSDDYIPPREPVWRRKNIQRSTSASFDATTKSVLV